MNDFKEFFFKEDKKFPIFKWIHYLDIYNFHFESFKNINPLILEIGVSGGGSLAMWNYYFKNKCKIIGIDINPKCKDMETIYSNMKIYIGDQRDKIFLEKIINENGTPDIIIDDGGHNMDEQRISFEFLYKYLSQNGVYLIEDTCTSYWSTYSSGLNNENSFMNFTKNKIDELNAWHWENKNENDLEFTKNTKNITFYDSVVVFTKKPFNNEPSYALKVVNKDTILEKTVASQPNENTDSCLKKIEQPEIKLIEWKDVKKETIPIEQYISRLKYWKSLGYKNSKAFIIWITPPFMLPIIQFLFNRKRFNKI